MRTKAVAAFALLSLLALYGCQTAPLGPVINGEVDETVLVRLPTPSDIASSYPKAAIPQRVSGFVRLSCRIAPSGELRSCAVLEEKPPGYGFADAALKLSRLFRLAPARYGPKARIVIPLAWELD